MWGIQDHKFVNQLRKTPCKCPSDDTSPIMANNIRFGLSCRTHNGSYIFNKMPQMISFTTARLL